VILPLALMLISGNTSGAKTAVSGERNRLSDFDAPLLVRAIIQRACADCHSEETKWPWYSNLPPVSWQIRADIDNARADESVALERVHRRGTARIRSANRSIHACACHAAA
jgi:hypothetical protein